MIRNSTGRRGAGRAIVWAAVAAVVTPAVSAQAQTWDGGGSDTLWCTPANWAGDVAPGNTGSAIVTMAGTTRLASGVDPSYDILALTFDSSAGPFSIESVSGSTLNLRGGGITNNSAATQTFNIDLTAGGSTQAWHATSGSMLFNNPVQLNKDVNLDSQFPVTFAGTIQTSNNAVLRINGPQPVSFVGSTPNPGATSTSVVVNPGGTLLLNKSAPNGAIAGTVVVSGVMRNVTANQVADDAFVGLSANATFDLNGFNETIGQLFLGTGAVFDSGSATLTAATLGFNPFNATQTVRGKINVATIPAGEYFFTGVPYDLDVAAVVGGMTPGANITVGFATTPHAGKSPRTVRFSGDGSNTFGSLRVEEATLLLAKSSGTAIPGDVDIDNGDNGSNLGFGTAEVRLGASNQIADTSTVTLGKFNGTQALFNLNGFSETIRTLTAGRQNVALGGGTLTVSTGTTYTGTTVDTGGGTLASPLVTMASVSGVNATIQGGGTFNPLATVTGTTTGTATIATANVLLTNASTVFNIADKSAAVDMTVSANFIGSGGLVKGGFGVLQLTGSSNHFSGQLALSLGALQLKALGTRVIHSGPVSVGGGTLDLADNKLITTSAVGTLSGATYTGVTGQIQLGRNGGNWSGETGILTTQTAATTGTLTSLGVATASQAKGIANNATALWAGQTVSGSETLVMYTYGGDATLDGKINVDDYGRIDSNANLPGVAGWFNGDFNYDGKINVDDYGIIDFNIGVQGAPFPTSSPLGAGVANPPALLSAVPEPGAIGVLALGALTLTRGRRASGRRSLR